MPNNMVSQQFPMPSSQGQLEAALEELNDSRQMGMMELGTTGPSVQHMSISTMQMELTTRGMRSPVWQQSYMSNMQTRVSDAMIMSLGSQVQAASNELSSQIDSQTSNPLWQPVLAPPYSSGGAGDMLNNLGSAQVSGKRKSPMEPMFNGSATQKLAMPMKRMEHRPWLQHFASPNNGSLQMQSSSLSPNMQCLPTPSTKTMQPESVSTKSRKQTLGRKQTLQAQPSSKQKNELYESVRSKMRESLAAALTLVQQRLESPKGVMDSQTETESSSGKAEPSSQPIESASGADASGTEGTTATAPTNDEGSSVQKENSGQASLLDNSTNGRTSDTGQFDDKKSHAFPQDEVSFSDNIFANDELLQGNGLLWVLDPVTDFGEKKDSETAEAPKSKDVMVASVEGEQSCQDPELLGYKIEMELFKLFGGVNKKYKEKGRSLLFNLKDKNNPDLRERVMSGEIPPERLCSMTAEELASKELSQWRRAKAEELAQMVVLPNTDVDLRRVVKKTHKGEFQVEVDPVDSSAVEISAGISSISRPLDKVEENESSIPAKAAKKKDEFVDKTTKKDNGASCTLTFPLNEGTDPMQGLSVDEEMKNTEFLPPIVSLDEFMESLNSEPPFEGLPEDDGKETPISEKSNSEVGSECKSPWQTALGPVDSPKAEPEKADVSPPKTYGVKLSGSTDKPDAPSTLSSIKGERVWDGLLQLSVSSLTSVIGIYKSGEKTATTEWPALLEVKGRVRVDAFAKFLRDLPKSRSRALMVMYFAYKGLSKSQRGNLSEVSEAYVADRRVGYAEPAPGVELYLCPPRGETLDMLSKVVSKDKLDDLEFLDDGLIGVVVWRRTLVSPVTTSRHKPSFKKQHSSTSRKQWQDNKSTTKPITVPDNRMLPMMNHCNGDDNGGGDDDDVPPGFGPGDAKDDDDLPEFNFSGGQFSSQASTQSRSVDQVRELIHKYGKSTVVGTGIQPWNDDDDDDIPEWRPQALPHQVPADPAHNYQTQMVNPQVGTMIRPASHLQAQANVLQPESWWAHQNIGGQHRLTPRGGAQPRSRGF